MKKLLLIDGSSLLHRAFYALPLLTSKDGMYTNAVHGFMMMFNKVLSQQRPDLVLVAFDKSRVTFRNEIDPNIRITAPLPPLNYGASSNLSRKFWKLPPLLSGSRKAMRPTI